MRRLILRQHDMHHHLNLLSSRAASPTPAQGRPAGRPVAPASPSDLTSAIYRRAAAAVLAGAMIVTATAHAAGSGSVSGAAVRQAPGTPREWVRTDVREPSYDAGGMLEPRGVAPAPGGLFYVADKGHDRIVVVNALGAIVRSIGSSGDGDGELTAPSDVAVDAARDRIYVADEGNRRLAIFTMSGAAVANWRVAGPDQAFAPHAVAVSAASGDVYVVSRLPWGRIERFASDGSWLDGWGRIGGGAREYRSPEDIAVHSDGRVLVADTLNNRVQVLDATGGYLDDLPDLPGVIGVGSDPTTGDIFALHSADQISELSGAGAILRTMAASDMGDDFAPGVGLAVGEDGRLAVTTGSGGRDNLHGLRQYEAGGALVASTLVDPLDHLGFHQPVAIAVDDGGSLFVLEGPLRVTRRFTAAGAPAGRFDDASGDEIAVGPGGDVYVVSAPIAGPTRLRRVRADGSTAWDHVCECYSGLGLAASSDRLYATMALTRSIGVLHPDVGGEPLVGRLGTASPPYAWPLDVSLGPDGRLYVAGGDSGRIEVFDGSAMPVQTWPVSDGGGAERVDVAPDGTVFALLFDGRIAAYDGATGALEAAWSAAPAPGAATASVRDIAAGPDGRLYALDDETHSVFVYEPRAATAATPTPEVLPESPCTVTGDKTASPGVVPLGDEVTVQLTLDIACPPGSEPTADIVLVIDRSNSMAGDKLRDAKSAAAAFVDGLDLARHRVALVSFSDIVSLDQPLTSDSQSVHRAIDEVQAHGATDIGAAVERALRHLEVSGRPDALGVMLVLTDGEPSGQAQAYVESVRHAGRARARGIVVYTIGLGANVDADLLTALAGDTERYFFAPSAADLEPIYLLLSQSLGAVVATDVQVVDVLGVDVDYVPGSASPLPAEDGGRVVWNIGAFPAGGIRPLSLRVTPTRLGLVPTNQVATAYYTAGGNRYSYEFPVPEVMVVEPPTPGSTTPSPTPTASASPTPRPSHASRLFLPYAARERQCPEDRRQPADIVLVVDTSSSMAGDKLAAAEEAARGFVALLNPERDRVGLVTFDDEATTVPLSSDHRDIADRIRGLPTHEGTRIDLGLYAAVAEFYRHGREGAGRVAILLSDGRPTEGYATGAIEQADLLRTYGAELYVIGLGDDADATLLRWLADSAAHYYYAPTPSDLADMYERIAARLPCD